MSAIQLGGAKQERKRMTVDRIEAAIPHRPPMRLIDEVLDEGESRIVCRKTFRPEEFFVQGHFPGFPLVPGVILCECCLQAGAILLSRHALGPNLVPVATRMDNVKFKRMVRPGEAVEVEATLNESLGKAFYLTGKVTVDGKLAARLDFACSVAESPSKAESPLKAESPSVAESGAEDPS